MIVDQLNLVSMKKKGEFLHTLPVVFRRDYLNSHSPVAQLINQRPLAENHYTHIVFSAIQTSSQIKEMLLCPTVSGGSDNLDNSQRLILANEGINLYHHKRRE